MLSRVLAWGLVGLAAGLLAVPVAGAVANALSLRPPGFGTVWPYLVVAALAGGVGAFLGRTLGRTPGAVVAGVGSAALLLFVAVPLVLSAATNDALGATLRSGEAIARRSASERALPMVGDLTSAGVRAAREGGARLPGLVLVPVVVAVAALAAYASGRDPKRL